MPGITLYEASIPLFLKGMETLGSILDKAAAHAKEKGLDADADYPGARLVEDMLPLSFQIQIASNTAKKTVARLTGEDTVGPWEDNEKTMAELKARVDKTIDLLKSVKPDSVDGKEDAIVELQRGKDPTLHLPAKAYLNAYAIPNFFFHVQTAYAILRMKGVPLGKRDYLAAFFKGYV